jgi:hypothetical protein
LVFRVWTKASVLCRLAGNLYRQNGIQRQGLPDRFPLRAASLPATRISPPHPGRLLFFRSRKRKRPDAVGPLGAGGLRVSRRALASCRHRHEPWRPWRP